MANDPAGAMSGPYSVVEFEPGERSVVEGVEGPGTTASPLPTASARLQELLFSPGLRIAEFAEFGEGAERARELW